MGRLWPRELASRWQGIFRFKPVAPSRVASPCQHGRSRSSAVGAERQRKTLWGVVSEWQIFGIPRLDCRQQRMAHRKFLKPNVQQQKPDDSVAGLAELRRQRAGPSVSEYRRRWTLEESERLGFLIWTALRFIVALRDGSGSEVYGELCRKK